VFSAGSAAATASLTLVVLGALVSGVLVGPVHVLLGRVVVVLVAVLVLILVLVLVLIVGARGERVGRARQQLVGTVADRVADLVQSLARGRDRGITPGLHELAPDLPGQPRQFGVLLDQAVQLVGDPARIGRDALAGQQATDGDSEPKFLRAAEQIPARDRCGHLCGRVHR
jgi:hypothetical protein